MSNSLNVGMFNRIRDLVKLFQDFGPLLEATVEYYNKFVQATTVSEKIKTLVDGLTVLAKLTPTENDDKVLVVLKQITESAIFDFIVEKIEEFLKKPTPTSEYEIVDSMIRAHDNTLAIKASHEAELKAIPWGVILQLIPLIIELIQKYAKQSD